MYKSIVDGRWQVPIPSMEDVRKENDVVKLYECAIIIDAMYIYAEGKSKNVRFFGFTTIFLIITFLFVWPTTLFVFVGALTGLLSFLNFMTVASIKEGVYFQNLAKKIESMTEESETCRGFVYHVRKEHLPLDASLLCLERHNKDSKTQTN